MTKNRTTLATPVETPAAAPAPAKRAWRSPSVLWEQPFKALLQASPLTGVPCDPSRDANCA